jgi:hypothetical protein
LFHVAQRLPERDPAYDQQKDFRDEYDEEASTREAASRLGKLPQLRDGDWPILAVAPPAAIVLTSLEKERPFRSSQSSQSPW